MRQIFPIVLLFLVGCGVAARPNTNSAPAELDLDYPIGPFSLTERSGRSITDQDLRGSVWVASFVFTHCSGPCPYVSANVGRLQLELKDEPNVKFVTFTVDPTRDDPARLREYANIHRADSERWLFLTGDEQTIHKMVREQFKQAVERNSQAGGKPGTEFDHSPKLLVVDKKGTIRAAYDGLPDERFPDAKERFEASFSRLKARVRELARAAE